jgi:hypothetical protein
MPPGLFDDLREWNPEALTADGFDAAYIGIAELWGETGERKLVAAYDRNKCIKVLMHDMGEEDAEEYFEFNVTGAYVGPYTPIFVTPRRRAR